MPRIRGDYLIGPRSKAEDFPEGSTDISDERLITMAEEHVREQQELIDQQEINMKMCREQLDKLKLELEARENVLRKLTKALGSEGNDKHDE